MNIKREARTQVALHPEGVDRNFYILEELFVTAVVALHPEGVDRNLRQRVSVVVIQGRPPPGGRG